MLSFFPRDVLDKIWDLIESVSEGFPTHSYLSNESEHSFFWGGVKFTKKNILLVIFLSWDPFGHTYFMWQCLCECNLIQN